VLITFLPEEEQSFAAIIALAMYFFWDLDVNYFDGSVLRISHDEFYALVQGCGKPGDELRKIIEWDIQDQP
jgi:hypothetical protein